MIDVAIGGLVFVALGWAVLRMLGLYPDVFSGGAPKGPYNRG